MSVAEDDARVREKAAKRRAEIETSRLSGQLREKAQSVFDLQHPGARSRSEPRGHETNLADLPNGRDSSILRVALSTHGPQTTFTVRGWLNSPDGNLVPMSGFGLSMSLSQLPGFAAAVAAALDHLEPGDSGLRLKNATPAYHAGVNGGGAANGAAGTNGAAPGRAT